MVPQPGRRSLRRSVHAERVLQFVRSARWTSSNLFAGLQAVAAFDHPVARQIIHDGLEALAQKQRKNGTFGTPCRIERVAAVLVAQRAIQTPKRSNPWTK